MNEQLKWLPNAGDWDDGANMEQTQGKAMSNESRQIQEAPATNVAERPTEAPILSMIQAAAQNADMDVEKLERMFALYERQQERDSIQAFNSDFVRLQADLPEINEGGQIIHNGTKISDYARWDEDIAPAIRPVLAKHNFVLSFETDTSDRVRVTAHLIHAEGHSRSGSFTTDPDTSGAKNSVQSMGSAVSYAKRYAAGPLLNLITRGADDDGRQAGSALISDARMADVIALRDELGIKPDVFSQWLEQKAGAEGGKVENIPAAKAKRIIEILESRRNG